MPTYAFALTTSQRRVVFSKPENAQVLLDLLFRHREEGRYMLHGFAITAVQVHLMVTPLRERTVQRCMECIRDEFAHKVRQRIPGEVWQTWALDHRVRSEQDYQDQLAKIAAIPLQRNMREYPFVHTQHPERIDPMPSDLQGEAAQP